ncbi:MAG: hypothetical protein J6K46_07200 [Sutterella sp.]|nr:hypothetical protein [Sutterella sp.]
MTQNFFSRPMRLVSREQETPDTWTLSFEPLDGRPFVWRPGQFICVKIGDTGESRCYSVSSTYGVNRYPTISVMRHEHGLGSNWLTQTVPVGSTIEISDPMGEFTCDASQSKKFLLMATGSGITPVLSMTRWLLVNRPDADLVVIYTVKSSEHVVQKALWDALVKYRPELKFLCFAKNAGAPFLSGRLNAERLLELVTDVAEREAYVCASPGFVAMSRDWCASLGMPASAYRTEAFGPAAAK